MREIKITWYGEPDNCWVASCPTKHMLTAFGDTEEEALHEFLIVEKVWDETEVKP